MANIATSVRIGGDAVDLLSELAAKLGQSKAMVIETALRQMEERMFWAEVRDAFDRIASDPKAAARQKAEVELWDRTSDLDFRHEKW